MLACEGLEIDTESFEVTVDSRQLALTFKEFELLRFLASHPGRVHTREALLNQVWGYEYFGGLRTVDVHVRRIRAKLGPNTRTSYRPCTESGISSWSLDRDYGGGSDG